MKRKECRHLYCISVRIQSMDPTINGLKRLLVAEVVGNLGIPSEK